MSFKADLLHDLGWHFTPKIAEGPPFFDPLQLIWPELHPYHNKSDQLLYVFFKRGTMRSEAVLLRDAMLDQYNQQPGDGVFRLWNLALSPRIGLDATMKPLKVMPELRRALVNTGVEGTPQALVGYLPASGTAGFSIPAEGGRDRFVPADYFGFSGNVVGAGFYVKDGVVEAVSSGSFYDKLTFCGIAVGMYDSLESLLKRLPASCQRIVSYSENGKLLTAVSTYIQQSPDKVGLRLWVTAGRIDGAYYWVEK